MGGEGRPRHRCEHRHRARNRRALLADGYALGYATAADDDAATEQLDDLRKTYGDEQRRTGSGATSPTLPSPERLVDETVDAPGASTCS